MWRALEPYHAVTYFAPESRQETESLGCRGGWASYFGLRAAPLGAVPIELVTATFYNFHPCLVSRALTGAWAATTPVELLAARFRAVDAALRRLLGDAIGSADLAEAAELAREAATAAPLAGRTLAAANAALEWPGEPHLVLWQAQTVLRESRGDGHVAALVAAGLDPCETLVAFAAEGRVQAEALRNRRGWSADEWRDAAGRLRRRGLLDDGGLTDEGLRVRGWVEERTDLAAAPSWEALGAQRCERLGELMTPLVAAVVGRGGFALDNPMGLRPLVVG
jgi:hypothetical protein